MPELVKDAKLYEIGESKMVSIREKIRKFARQRNLVGFACSMLLSLFRSGPRRTARKIYLHFSRKRDEKSFVARMWPQEEELERQREMTFPSPIRFSIAVPLYNTPIELLKETINSVREQTYADWELCLADGSDGNHEEVGAWCREQSEKDPRIKYRKLEKNGGISENTNACLEMATGDYIALFDHDDLLMPNALFEMRSAIEKTGADFLYSDEMVFNSPRRDRIVGIRLKPSFSPDSLLANNYICHLTVFSKELLLRAGGFRKKYDGSQDHDIILRLTNQARGIAHISKVLYLWRSIPGSTASDIYSKSYAIEAGRSAVEDFLRDEKNLEASVESSEVFPTMYRVRYSIHENPSVRVILDAGRERNSLEKKVKALEKTAGWDRCAWTLLTSPEASAEEESQKDFDLVPARVGESRSALWNRAAEASEEDFLLFIAGVPEPLSEGWLAEMLGLAQQEHIGVVGAKIHCLKGDVRHAGVVIGMGSESLAGRAYYLADRDSAGYFGQMAVVENVAAVTDCLMVSREKWQQGGKFSEKYEDALFDVDLCVRLLEKGYYNVLTPHARLKMGRMKDIDFNVGKEYATYEKDAAVFQKRNEGILKQGDPCFNPNLSLKYEDWRIRRQ